MQTSRSEHDRPSPRWRERPVGSNWGDFGSSDSLGRLNLVGPEQVHKGVAAVRDGQTFSLSLPLDQPRGAVLSAHRLAPIIRPTLRKGHVNFNCDMSVAYDGATDIVSDDLVVLHTQFSTQWDAFGHVGGRFDADADGVTEIVYYNGWRAGREVIGPTAPSDAGLASLSQIDGAETGEASTSNAGPVDISHMARHGVQGRAVLLDLEDHFGPERRTIGGNDIIAALEARSASVEQGDILLLHTGFARALLDGLTPGDLADRGPVLDGADGTLHDWIRDSGVAAIAADNHAVEAFPPPHFSNGQPVLPLHELCLFRLGIHLGELWWLSDLARHLTATDRTDCLLTAPPLNLPGATGSPVTPVATT